MLKKNGELKQSYDISNNDFDGNNLLIESKNKFKIKKKKMKQKEN